MKNAAKTLVVLSLGLAACTAFAAGKVVLYSSNNVDTLKIVTDGFEKKYPDIKVSVVRDGTGSLMKRIKAESKNPMGDIFWSGGLSTIDQFTAFQEPYTNKETKAVPSGFRDPAGHWLGTNQHVAVLLVNTSALPKGAKVPSTWKELADPIWKGNVIAPDPAKSGTSYSTLFGLREVVGDDIFKKIVGNMVIAGSSSGAYEGPARGEFAVGITMEYAGSEYIEGGTKNLKLVYPSEGTMTMPEGMFILKGAKNLENAKKLYDYISSRDTQVDLFKKTFRRPLRTDIDAKKYSSLPSIGKIKIHAVDPKSSGDKRDAFLKDFAKIARAAKSGK